MLDWLYRISYLHPYLLYLVLLGPALLFSIIAQIKVKSTYRKYSQFGNSLNLTGAEAARRILDSKGLYDVAVVPISGSLTDHYDPRTNTVSLSQGVYDSSSIAAVGIAAHEVGHAIQYSEKYAPIKLRSAMVGVTNFGSKLSGILIFGGLILMAFANTVGDFGYYAALLGVALFSLSAIFQLITLPVEFNASSRARKQVSAVLFADAETNKGVKKVLSAAAMTYVAALFTSIVQILYYVVLITGRRRD